MCSSGWARSSISATHGPYSAHTKGLILTCPAQALHPRVEKQSGARGEGRGETVEMEQLAPLGDVGRFLTPGMVCSLPDACPHQADGTARCSIHSSENLAEQRGKMGFSKQQRGILGWLHSKPHPWFALWDGVSPLALHTKRIAMGKQLARCQRKVSSAQPESCLQPNPQCFLPFWGSFLHFFNPSPFDWQHCSSTKCCFEIKKPKKCFVLKKC